MEKKRRILASILVGVLGALFGLLEGLAGTLEGIDNGRSNYYAHFTLPAGAVSGFFLCFLLSVVYLRFMTNQIGRSQTGWGSLFGAFAGALSGLIMYIALIFAGISDPWWVIPSTISGAIIGTLMTLIGRSFLNKLIR